MSTRWLLYLTIVLASANWAKRHAAAHDQWISRGGFRNPAGEWCCGENDCEMWPKQDVLQTRNGYLLILRLVDGQEVGRELVPYGEAQPSPDGEYWRCKRSDQTRRCFFAPPPNT